MRKLLILLFLSLPVVLNAQVDRQPEYINFRKAKKVLDRAVQYGGFGTGSLNISVTASGTIHESGHFAMPEERVDMPEKCTLRMFSGIENFFINGETTYRGRPLIRQVYVKQDSLFYRDYFDRSVNHASLVERKPFYDEILTLHPALVLGTLRRSLPSLRYLGKDGPADLLSFSANQTTFTLRVLPDGQISQASYLAIGDYYGDNVHRFEYLEYQPVGAYKLPTRFKEYEFGALRKEETFTYDLKPAAGLPTNQVCTGCSLMPQSNATDEVTVKNVGAGLYAVELNTYNNRSLFLAGDKGVTVFEAPLSYKAGQSVIDAVKKTTNGKPITQVVVTHHHPDHAGGLRAFAEQGAKIITTKGNMDFFRRLVNYPHQLEGNPNNKLLNPLILAVDSVQTFGAGTDEPFALYFTSDTQHTKEYLLAYFPKQKVLFHGDLCYFIAGSESAASVRDQAVARVITRYKLDVEKIYGSWPVKGYKEFGTKADLDRKLDLATK